MSEDPGTDLEARENYRYLTIFGDVDEVDDYITITVQNHSIMRVHPFRNNKKKRVTLGNEQ